MSKKGEEESTKPKSSPISGFFKNLRHRKKDYELNQEEEIEFLDRKPVDDKEINETTNLILDSLSLKDEEVNKSKTMGKMNERANKLNSSYNLMQRNKLKSIYKNGLMRILDSSGILNNPDGSLYMNFRLCGDLPVTEQLLNVPSFMASVWNMKSPQIIIPIITGISNFKNWRNQKLEDQFRKGIIKAANKTEMWFITSGINGGLPAMIGNAFNEEIALRHTSGSDESISRLKLGNETEKKPLTLIGIVSASSLQNCYLFDGVTTALKATGNKSDGSEYRFDPNPNHTHMIIYNDLINHLANSRLRDNPSGDSLLNEVSYDPKSVKLVSYDLFRSRIESMLTRSLSHYKKIKLNTQSSEISDDENPEYTQLKVENRQIPMVCLMLRGDLSSIDAVEFKIRREIPVIVFKGSGGASDIISFAYDEYDENKDPEYEDNFIKPELYKKLNSEFESDISQRNLNRYQIRDKILSIVKNSTKNGQKFLSIVDMKGLGFDFIDMDKYILTALFQSQPQLSKHKNAQRNQIERNLRLTLDWNMSSLALSEVFQRDDYTKIEIKQSMFECALLRSDREDFIELFLDQGFYLHRFLSRENIRTLFTKAENREFFVTIILQGILGHFTSELPENFLPDGLNEVLRRLTNIDGLLNMLEIYVNQLGLGFYVPDGCDAKRAEKKALNFLIIYAILFNRQKLAKLLWKRTDDPLALALICSLMYKNMQAFCQESYLKSQIESYQNEFAKAAIGVLDSSFKSNDPRSYSILDMKHSEWNNCTVLELAYNAKNLDFIAHPCCQKILTKRLFGEIQIRDLETKKGLFDFPSWIKCLLSALLILPMYYWIVFPLHEEKEGHKNDKNTKSEAKTKPCNEKNAQDTVEEDYMDEDPDGDDDENEGDELDPDKKLINEINRKKALKPGAYRILLRKLKSRDSALKKNLDSNKKSSQENEEPVLKSLKYSTPSFFKKIYMVWNAPFTKFWINFVCYICYLVLFGIVTLWPCCGNLLLDSILWLWTATIVIEDTRIAYKNYMTGSQLPMKASIIEILVMIIFLIMFYGTRIVSTWNNQFTFFFALFGMDRIFMSKAVLCIFLLYFYYRTLFIFLPISHQLGPMLVRMKLMVKHDFMIYMRLFLISMTAGGIALNAILYPFHPINYELMKRVLLFRGFLQLFAADKIDLERKTDDCRITNLSHRILEPYSCANLTTGVDFSYPATRLESYGVSYKCNYLSLTAWFILIQYFLLIKLFLPTLLTAMFSTTGQLVSQKSEQLWMYQRYEIVMEYEKRLVFAPPFTIIVYVYQLIKLIVSKIYSLVILKLVAVSCCKTKRKASYDLQKTGETADGKSDHGHYYHDLPLVSNPAKTASNESLNKQAKATVATLEASTHTIKKENHENIKTVTYWSNLAQDYMEELKKETQEKSIQKQMETNINKIREDLGSQKKAMQRLNDRVISLEKALINNQSYLEQIKNLVSQKTSKSGLSDRKKKSFIHILSRESPYVFTNIPRFFVYEKLVPWECSFDLYDPPFIVVAVETFKLDAIFIDGELNSKISKDEIQTVTSLQTNQAVNPAIPPPPTLAVGVSASATTSSTQINMPTRGGDGAVSVPSSPPPQAKLLNVDNALSATPSGSNTKIQEENPESAAARTRLTSQAQSNTLLTVQAAAKQLPFLWNSITVIDIPNQPGKKLTIDRTSWITTGEDSQRSLIYPLDSFGYPINPMGRTGVRGRGALLRYGPNHEIFAVVTRWKKQKNRPIYVERRKLLEFVAVKDTNTGLTRIPGDRILGDESQYSVVSRTFMEMVFEQDDVEKGTNFGESDMLNFFATFAIQSDEKSQTTVSPETFNELGFIPTMIYRGYIDDPRNTDNAWIEAEVWNFHYDREDSFNRRIKNPGNKWREVSSNVRISTNEVIGDVLKEITEIHNAFYS